MPPNRNAIQGLFSSVQLDSRPKLYYFGKTANATLCQEKCDMEEGCYAFAFGLPSMNVNWRRECHGRGFGSPETLVSHTRYTSGVKLC